MKPRAATVLLLAVVVALAGLTAFAAACGSSETATTAATATTTSAVAATGTTAPAGPTTTAGSTAGATGSIVVKGMVDNPMTLTVAELEKMNVITTTVEHPKLGAQEYRGVLLSDIFAVLKVQSAATTMVMGASDGFMAELPLADVKANKEAMIAVGDDGTLNGVMPGMEGKAWVKDIVSMEFK